MNSPDSRNANKYHNWHQVAKHHDIKKYNTTTIRWLSLKDDVVDDTEGGSTSRETAKVTSDL